MRPFPNLVACNTTRSLFAPILLYIAARTANSRYGIPFVVSHVESPIFANSHSSIRAVFAFETFYEPSGGSVISKAYVLHSDRLG